jgi:hypothetical protein
LELLLDNIKSKLNAHFENDLDFINFVKYHNLFHYYLAKNNINPTQREILIREYHLKKIHNITLQKEWEKIFSYSQDKAKIYLLKGINLSKQIYSDLSTRPTRDIDIYVNFEELFIVDSLLKQLEYKRIKPVFDLNLNQKKFLGKHIHHFTYINKKNIVIELHWQLFTPKNLFENGESIFNEIDYNAYVTYPIEWLLHYLITHGSMHHWFKLFWLYDIHHIITNYNVSWNKFNEYANKFNNSRIVNSSLYLSKAIFETDVPFKIKLNETEKKILQYCLKSIVKQENFLALKGIKRIKRNYYLSLLKKENKYKYKIWIASWTTLEDWKTIRLPSSLYWLYYILRPFIWFYINYIKNKK